jgi:hypothetical protein
MGVTIKKSGEAPSEQIRSAARATETVTDELGRSITVKKLSPFDRMQLNKAVGAENSANQNYMVYAAVAFSVKDLDGEAVITPRTEREVELIVQRLGEEGFEAAATALGSMYVTAGSEDILEAAKK